MLGVCRWGWFRRRATAIMIDMLRALIAIASFSLAFGCSSQTTSTDTTIDHSDTKPADLRIRAKVGDTGRYHAVTDMRAEGKGALHWEVSWDETATKVGSNSSTWRTRLYGVKAEGTGVFKEKAEEIKSVEGVETENNVGPQGHDLGGEGASGATANITLPDRPIRPGEGWESEIESNGQKMRIRYTFMRRVTENGRPAVLIEGIAVEDQPIKSLTPGRYVIDEETGKVISAKVEYEVIPAKMRMSFEVTRL